MRADQQRVTLTVAGVSYGVFDKKSGGLSDSEELKYRKGGMGPERTFGGPGMTENVTISKIVEGAAGWAEIRALRQQRGRGACTCVVQALDDDGNAIGQPDVYTGILKSVSSPDHDSNSADAAEVTVEISTNESIG